MEDNGTFSSHNVTLSDDFVALSSVCVTQWRWNATLFSESVMLWGVNAILIPHNMTFISIEVLIFSNVKWLKNTNRAF